MVSSMSEAVDKVTAVRLVREISGAGLRRAFKIVDGIESGFENSIPLHVVVRAARDELLSRVWCKVRAYGVDPDAINMFSD